MPPLQTRSTGCHRLGDHDVVDRLMRATPAISGTLLERQVNQAGVSSLSACLGRTFRRAGGPLVTYREYGAPGGLPVLALHGTPGSRLKYAAADRDAARMGLRIISPDRWGYGRSDPHPQPKLAAY